jgi:hypothetical protein
MGLKRAFLDFVIVNACRDERPWLHSSGWILLGVKLKSSAATHRVPLCFVPPREHTMKMLKINVSVVLLWGVTV